MVKTFLKGDNMNKPIIIILLIVSIFGLTGCYDSPEVSRQKLWNESLYKAANVEYQFRDDDASLLLAEQLISLVGEPDYKMLPIEFEKLLPEDEPSIEGLSYREWHMLEIWNSYRRDKGQYRFYVKEMYVGKWRDALDFSKCMLWIYDESLHFKKPLYSGDILYCWFCMKPHFTTRIFFIEDSVVVGLNRSAPPTKRDN